MLRKLRSCPALALMLVLSLSTIGCLSPLARHSTALSAATTPVVEQASAAYHASETLHDLRVDYDAFAKFDDKRQVYNPRGIQPLMTDKDIETRLTILAALQTYAQSLVEITNGTTSPALDAASKSVGSNLTSLGNSVAPSIESALGIATAPTSTTETTVTTRTATTSTTTSSTSSTPAPLITPAVQNGISAAANALGQFLVSKKIKKELPQIIKEMNPHVEAFCELLEKDIDILQEQADRDYNSIINSQTLYIRESATLDPQQRRDEIMKLPRIVRQQRATEQRLTKLRASIVRLALTHHALAAAAQGNNPQSLKDKLEELAAAGSALGNYYSSLPGK